jgi:hypothetical protein
LLAGAMKVLPFDYEIPRGRQYRYYQPDLLIALVNQALFLALAVLTFRLGVRLFDPGVAWGAVVALVGSELMWQFSVSGLPTMLLANLVVLVTLCLAALERRAREGSVPPGNLVRLGLVALFLRLVHSAGGVLCERVRAARTVPSVRGGGVVVCGGAGALAGAELQPERHAVRHRRLRPA